MPDSKLFDKIAFAASEQVRAGNSPDFAALGAEKQKAHLDQVEALYKAEMAKHITADGEHLVTDHKMFNGGAEAVSAHLMNKDAAQGQKLAAEALKAHTFETLGAALDIKSGKDIAERQAMLGNVAAEHAAQSAEHSIKSIMDDAGVKTFNALAANNRDVAKDNATAKKLIDDIGGQEKFDALRGTAKAHIETHVAPTIEAYSAVRELQEQHKADPIKEGADPKGELAAARAKEVKELTEAADKKAAEGNKAYEEMMKAHGDNAKMKEAATRAYGVEMDEHRAANAGIHDAHAQNVKAGLGASKMGDAGKKLGETDLKASAGIEHKVSEGLSEVANAAEKMGKLGRAGLFAGGAALGYAAVKVVGSGGGQDAEGKPVEKSTFRKVANVAMGAALAVGAGLALHGAVKGVNPVETFKKAKDAMPWVDKVKKTASTAVGRGA